LPVSQETYVQMSGLLTPIANTETAVCTTAPCPPAAMAATSNAIQGNRASVAATSGTSASSSSIIFNLSGPTGGMPGDTLTAWLLISNGFTFDKKHPFRIIEQSREDLVEDVDVPHPDADVPFSPCAAVTVQCLEVEFNRYPGKGFGPEDSIQFSQGILVDSSPITLDELCGAKVVYIFKSGAIITSALGPCSGSGATLLTANPQNPDATTPNQVVNPNTLITSNNPPCTLDPVIGLCPDPRVTGVEDGNPSEQAQQCYFHGSPVQCP